MGMIKTCKNFFHFLQSRFIKILAVAGALLIIAGSLGLFFGQKSEDKVFGLTLALAGYILVTLISYFGFILANQKELKSQQSSRREKGY